LPSEFEKMAYLWCTSDNLDLNNYEWDLNRSESLMRIINERRERADGLIIVSHLEISGFSEYFFQKEFGQRERAKTIRQGCAAHIDLEKRTCQIIPQ
jgi:hypothetical protein